MTTQTYTLAIADIANSNSDELQQVEVTAGTSVKDALALKGVVVHSGQKVALNGVNTTLDSPINVAGMLSITGEAKAAN